MGVIETVLLAESRMRLNDAAGVLEALEGIPDGEPGFNRRIHRLRAEAYLSLAEAELGAAHCRVGPEVRRVGAARAALSGQLDGLDGALDLLDAIDRPERLAFRLAELLAGALTVQRVVVAFEREGVVQGLGIKGITGRAALTLLGRLRPRLTGAVGVIGPEGTSRRGGSAVSTRREGGGRVSIFVERTSGEALDERSSALLLRAATVCAGRRPKGNAAERPQRDGPDKLLQVKIDIILDALESCGWVQAGAAAQLHMSRSSLNRFLGQHNLLDSVRSRRAAVIAARDETVA